MHRREARRKRERAELPAALAALVACTPADGNLQRYLYETYVWPSSRATGDTHTQAHGDGDEHDAGDDRVATTAAQVADAVLRGPALRRLVAALGPRACPRGVCDLVAVARRVPRSRSSEADGVYVAELCFAANAATLPSNTHERRRVDAAATPLDESALLLQHYKQPALFAAITRCDAPAHAQERHGYDNDDNTNSPNDDACMTCATCAELWRRFVACVAAPLPMTLRVHGSEPVLRRCALRVLRHDAQLRACGVRAVAMLPHTPSHYATALYSCSHAAYHNSAYVQRVCRTLHAASAVSFHEVVSALPVLVLDVRPHHRVLDMCAAPGSKTLQALDAMLDGNGQGWAGTAATTTSAAIAHSAWRGVLVCNDKDRVKATQTLPARLKRYHAPNVLCTRCDATQWPRVYTVASSSTAAATHRGDEDATSTAPQSQPLPLVEQRFDRVLCDVPCSGDGTLRKERAAALTWSPRYVADLVPTQRALLLRGLEVLRVGGVLVYSTCSLNPAEDEAVVCTALDVYNHPRGSQRASDDKTDNNNSNSNDDDDVCIELLDVPAILRARGACVHSCGGVRRDDLRTLLVDHCSGDGEGSTGGRVPASYDADKVLRVLPHADDTGGFFIAAFRKRRAPAWTPPTVQRAKLNQWTHGRLWAPVTPSDAAWRSIIDFYGLDQAHDTRSDATTTTTTADAVARHARSSFAFATLTPLPSSVVVVDDNNNDNDNDDDDNDNDGDALVPLYQLNPHGTPPRRIVLVTRAVAQLLLRSWPYKGPGVEVVTAGVRAFEMYDARYVPRAACRWRAVVEAASFVAPRCAARTLTLHARAQRPLLHALLRDGYVYLHEHWRALLLLPPSPVTASPLSTQAGSVSSSSPAPPWTSFVRDDGALATLLREASAAIAHGSRSDGDDAAEDAYTTRFVQLADEELRVGGVLLGIVDDDDDDDGDDDSGNVTSATTPWYVSATLSTRKLELAIDASLRAFGLLTYFGECDDGNASSSSNNNTRNKDNAEVTDE